MLSFLLGLVNPVFGLASKIADLIIARQAAATDLEKADIQRQIDQLQAQRDVMLAENNKLFTLNGCLRGLAAIGPIAYVTKVFLWDKVIGAFVGCSGVAGDRDPLCHIYNTDILKDPNLNWVMVAVIGFYFLTSKR